MERKERKSVDNIFRYISEKVWEQEREDGKNILETKISVRRNFGEFFKMVYNNLVGSDICKDVPLHMLTDEQFRHIRESICQLVIYVSSACFSEFIKNKKNWFSLYNINAINENERRLQIDFYCDFVGIMEVLYTDIQKNVQGNIYQSEKIKIHNKRMQTQQVLQLLRKQNEFFYGDIQSSFGSTKAQENNSLEKLIQDFQICEEKGIKGREDMSIIKLNCKLEELAIQILEHKELSELDREYFEKKYKYYEDMRMRLVVRGAFKKEES